MSFASEYRDTIMWGLDGMVTQLNRTGVDPTRVAFLVDEREWNELAQSIRQLSSYISEDDLSEMPVTRITYRGYAVRKR